MTRGTVQTGVQRGGVSDLPASAKGVLQRQCACGNHAAGDQCATCAENAAVLRRSNGEAAADEAPPSVYDALRSAGQPLDRASQAFMARQFDRDFSHVRVHTDARAAESARDVNALAYTVGNHLVFAPGQYAPGTAGGRRLLAHELVHTIQQGSAPSASHGGLWVAAGSDPAESAADAAADAALRGAPVPGLRAAPAMVSREEGAGTAPRLGPRRIDFGAIYQTVPPPSGYRITRVENTDNDDVKRVYLDNGQRYRITRRRWITRREGGGRAPFTRLEPGIDRQRVWMELEWCSNETEGRIRVGANVPEQVINFVVTNVTSGGDADRALREIRLTPYTEAELRVGRWRITAGAEATVDVGGEATGAGGRVGVETETSAGRVGVRARVGSERVGENPLGGVQGGIVIEFTPGAPSQSRPGCRLQRETLVENIRYDCQLERDIPPRSEPRTRQLPRRDSVTRFIYFDYALPRIDRRRSADGFSGIASDLRQGFRISGVRGFASPEGPLGPGRRFEGNIELSRERAEAALAETQRICQRELGEGQSCTAREVSPTGMGELYTLVRLDAQGVEREVEGPPQVEHATERFLAEEQEASHRTPELERRLGRARTPQARAALVYPLLRRAAIDLERTRMETETYMEQIPGRVETIDVLGGCPQDMVSRAFPEAGRRQ